VAAGGLTLLLTALPEILIVAPKIGAAIYNLLHAYRDELPEETLKRLDDVKLRQAAEEAIWAADLQPPAGGGDVPAGADPSGDSLSAVARQQAAALLERDAEIRRLNNELTAARQAGYGTGGGVPVEESEDTANGGPPVDPDDLPPPPEPAGP
jgi:hypothetical protein